MRQPRHRKMVTVANHAGETREIMQAAADPNVLSQEGWHIVSDPPPLMPEGMKIKSKQDDIDSLL